MTRLATESAGLIGLERRLTSGIALAALRTMPDDWPEQAASAIRQHWPASDFAALDNIRRSSWKNGNLAATAISSLGSHLREQRSLLLAVLFCPDKVLDRLCSERTGSDFPLTDTWIGLLWVAAAAFGVVAGELSASGGFAALDGDLLRPLAARLLFLVTSEPMRSRNLGDTAWWGGADRAFGGSGILERVIGHDSWHLLVAECQRARREWLGCLSAYQSHAYLAQALPQEIEAELRTLIFGRGRPGSPLGVSAAHLEDWAPLTAQDKTIIDEVVVQHFLPRFDLLSVIPLALCANRRGPFWSRLVTGGLAFGGAVASVTCAALLHIRFAALLAMLALLIVGGGVAVFGRAWAAPWMLRFPAAAAIGVTALISLAPGRWVTGPPGGWRAVAVLAAAAFGYLVIEARNHGVGGIALLGRSLAVAVAGAGYGVLIALVGLVIVAPAFTPDGRAIAALWARPGYSHAGLALWLAASWCLAVGVFSQILWDDRPITAPLAHLSWRNR